MDIDVLDLLDTVDVEDEQEKNKTKKRGNKKVVYNEIKKKEFISMMKNKLPDLDENTIEEVLANFLSVNLEIAKKSFNDKISTIVDTPIGKVKVDYFDKREVWNPADLVYTETEEKVQIKFKTKRMKEEDL